MSRGTSRTTSQQSQDGPTKSFESAERSSTVQSANWKEHMLLQKKLHILNRSERNLVHRITIDQKVVFRRFQMKLHRSKLGFAELKGRKEDVIELRRLHLRGLNTNCGQNEDDYAFLNKLQYRPCTADGSRLSTPKSIPRIKSVDKDLKDLEVKSAPAIRSMSAGGRFVGASRERVYSGSGKRLELSLPIPVRPRTAAGTQIEKEFAVMPEVPGESVEDRMINFVARMQRPDEISPEPPKIPNGGQSHVSFKALTNTGNGSLSPKEMRPCGDELSPKTTKGRGGSMFDEVKKVNILELFLSEAKSIDNKPRVKGFCESIESYGTGCKEFDYYAQKMQSEVEQSKKADPVSIPGTPDIENNKFIGNTKVKSLTMPLLKFTFDDDRLDGVDVNPDEPAVHVDDQPDMGEA